MPPLVSTDPEFAQMLQAELATEAVRYQHHRSEAERHEGVAWSGVSPVPFRPRPIENLRSDAEARLVGRRVWRASADGRFIAAVAQYQAAALAAYAAGERARAALARGADAQQRHVTVDDMKAGAEALTAASTAAAQALEP